MNIVISDSYRNKLKALENACLEDEVSWHESQYGCKPKKVIIVPFIESRDEKYKPTKHTMILTPEDM